MPEKSSLINPKAYHPVKSKGIAHIAKNSPSLKIKVIELVARGIQAVEVADSIGKEIEDEELSPEYVSLL